MARRAQDTREPTAEARDYLLPIPILFRGELVPAGETVPLYPDQVVRVEAAARAAGALPAAKTVNEEGEHGL